MSLPSKTERSFPVGTRLKYQHWVVVRPDAWELMTIVGEPKKYFDDILWPVVHPGGWSSEINLDAIAHVEAVDGP